MDVPRKKKSSEEYHVIENSELIGRNVEDLPQSNDDDRGPIKIYLKLNNYKRSHPDGDCIPSKRIAKWNCSRCRVTFYDKTLFETHLIDHIYKSQVRIKLNKLPLPDYIVKAAINYYKNIETSKLLDDSNDQSTLMTPKSLASVTTASENKYELKPEVNESQESTLTNSENKTAASELNAGDTFSELSLRPSIFCNGTAHDTSVNDLNGNETSRQNEVSNLTPSEMETQSINILNNPEVQQSKTSDNEKVSDSDENQSLNNISNNVENQLEKSLDNKKVMNNDNITQINLNGKLNTEHHDQQDNGLSQNCETQVCRIEKVVSLANRETLNSNHGNQQLHVDEDPISSCCCSYCSEIRSGDLLTKTQVTAANGQLNYQCAICSILFSKKNLFFRHCRASNHSYLCEICGSGFFSQELHQLHLKLHVAKQQSTAARIFSSIINSSDICVGKQNSTLLALLTSNPTPNLLSDTNDSLNKSIHNDLKFASSPLKDRDEQTFSDIPNENGYSKSESQQLESQKQVCVINNPIATSKVTGSSVLSSMNHLDRILRSSELTITPIKCNDKISLQSTQIYLHANKMPTENEETTLQSERDELLASFGDQLKTGITFTEKQIEERSCNSVDNILIENKTKNLLDECSKTTRDILNNDVTICSLSNNVDPSSISLTNLKKRLSSKKTEVFFPLKPSFYKPPASSSSKFSCLLNLQKTAASNQRPLIPSIMCYACNLNFQTINSFQIHFDYVHRSYYQKMKDIRLTNYSKLHDHNIEHVRNIICKKCSLSFKWYYDLIVHWCYYHYETNSQKTALQLLNILKAPSSQLTDTFQISQLVRTQESDGEKDNLHLNSQIASQDLSRNKEKSISEIELKPINEESEKVVSEIEIKDNRPEKDSINQKAENVLSSDKENAGDEICFPKMKVPFDDHFNFANYDDKILNSADQKIKGESVIQTNESATIDFKNEEPAKVIECPNKEGTECNPKNYYKCSFCKRSFNNSRFFELHLRLHVKRQSKTQQRTCNYCCKVFGKIRELKNHLKMHYLSCCRTRPRELQPKLPRLIPLDLLKNGSKELPKLAIAVIDINKMLLSVDIFKRLGSVGFLLFNDLKEHLLNSNSENLKSIFS